jgi:hypothetical protein
MRACWILLALVSVTPGCYTSRTVRYPDGRWERTVAIGLEAEINANWLTGTTVKGRTAPGGLLSLVGAAIGQMIGGK